MRPVRRLTVCTLAAGAVLAFTPVNSWAAVQATPGCTLAAPIGCGSELSIYRGLAMDSKGQLPVQGNPVIAFSYSTTDPALDFIFSPAPRQNWTAPLPAPSSVWKTFEYAPLGVPSGYCVADPDMAGTGGHGLILSKCNPDSGFQAWHASGPDAVTRTDGGVTQSGFEWINAADGRAMSVSDTTGPGQTVPGRAVQLTTVPALAPTTTGTAADMANWYYRSS